MRKGVRKMKNRMMMTNRFLSRDAELIPLVVQHRLNILSMEIYYDMLIEAADGFRRRSKIKRFKHDRLLEVISSLEWEASRALSMTNSKEAAERSQIAFVLTGKPCKELSDAGRRLIGRFFKGHVRH